MDESQPPPKVRRRRLACHCQLCNGEERDYRTVQSHAMNFPPHTPVSTNQDDEMMITDEVDLPNEVVTDGNSTANEVVTPTEDSVIKQQKSGYTKEVLKFILEELKVKLKYGTSYHRCGGLGPCVLILFIFHECVHVFNYINGVN